MIEEIALRVEPRIAADMNTLIAQAAIKSRIDRKRIKGAKIVKRSIDARQRKVMVNITLRIYIDEMPSNTSLGIKPTYRDVDDAQQVIVVGAGPAGLFAALRLIELGLKPVVLERGKDVDERRKDMAKIARENIVNPDSNYCFGEGGAGAYSDGKLYTRSKKRGSVDKILSLFHSHGASEDILVDAHPHIGTDKLPDVIKAMRMTIIRHGGEVHFNTRVTDLNIDGDTVTGVTTTDGTEYAGPVILATGHSARDIYMMLKERNVDMEAKGIAVGVRLEHPQQLIDSIQYHNPHGRGKYLPAAEYSMLTRVDNRGVYSFCMCPGGYVVDASSEQGRLVVNGMSYSGRSGCNANSAIIVSVTPEDFEGEGVLAGMEFQRKLEEKAFQTGFGTIPVERYSDYKEAVDGMMGRENKEYQKKPSMISQNFTPQIKGRWSFGAVHEILPISLSKAFVEGMEQFGTVIKGFNDGNVLVEGVESRTSSPVRILRDENLQSSLKGLYPCGEGAGYAGGITSAAMDGIRVAEELAVHIINRNKH